MFLEKFKYTLVYLDVYYVILITGCFNYLQLSHLFPFFGFFSKKHFLKRRPKYLKNHSSYSLEIFRSSLELLKL